METERQIAVSLFLVLVMNHLQNRDVVIRVAFMKKQTDMDTVCTLLSITIFVSYFYRYVLMMILSGISYGKTVYLFSYLFS